MKLIKRLKRLRHSKFFRRAFLTFVVLGFIWLASFGRHNKAAAPIISRILGREIVDNPILFVETSGRKTISLRVVCAIESAAALHPHRPIRIYSIAPLATNHPNTEKLTQLRNVHFEVLQLDILFLDTPLQKWHESGVLKFSQYPVQHLSDAVRLALLWKGGGTYLDTDIITIRSLDNFNNALGCGLNTTAGNSVLVFEKQHVFLYECMSTFTSGYSVDSYDNQGPILVTKVLQRMCIDHPDQIQDVIDQPNKCQGVTLLPPYTFFPFGWLQWKTLFSPGEEVTSNSYTVHLYAKVTARVKGHLGVGSFLESLAKQHCPTTYQRMLAVGKL